MPKQKSNFDRFFELISPQIKDIGEVPLIKEALIYQLLADKFNVFVCGDPGAGGKSSFREVLEKVSPSFQYFSFVGHSTKIGLSQVVRRLREGLLQVDEIGRCSPRDVSILFDVLQFQRLKLDKYQKHKSYTTPVNIYATSNPTGKNNKWESYGNPDLMREQIPISSTLHRRFHTSIFTKDYTSKEFNEVNRHKVKKMKKFERDGNSREHNQNPIIKEEDAKWMKNKILELRKIKPKVNVPDNVFQWLEKLKYFDDEVVMPITPEIIEGVIEVSKANCRLREGKKVSSKDWKKTLLFFHKSFKTGGLDNELIQEKLGLNI